MTCCFILLVVFCPFAFFLGSSFGTSVPFDEFFGYLHQVHARATQVVLGLLAPGGIERVEPELVAQMLVDRQHIGDALLFRYLAQLRTDVPLPDSLADLEWKGVLREPFLALCDELGATGLQDRPHRWAE